MLSKTIAIIKPGNSFSKHKDDILSYICQHLPDATIINRREMVMNKEMVMDFYKEHSEKSFFHEIVDYMTSGTVLCIGLQGSNVITRFRELIGHTNPKEADKNTIRSLYGESIEKNAIHGSADSDASEREFSIIFGK